MSQRIVTEKDLEEEIQDIRGLSLALRVVALEDAHPMESGGSGASSGLKPLESYGDACWDISISFLQNFTTLNSPVSLFSVAT